MIRIGAVILSYNNKKLLQRTLDSLEKVKRFSQKRGIGLEIVVVDNGSTDQSLDYLRGLKSIKLISNEKNLGFCQGNNIGIRHFLKEEVDYILLINNDTEAEKDFLFHLIKAGEKHSGAGVLGPKIYFASGYEFHKDRYSEEERGKVIWFAGGVMDWQNVLASHRGVDEVDRGQFEKEVEPDFITGCAMLIKRAVLEKIGDLDERFFLYLEDLEFCQRAKKNGFSLLFVPQAKVWHLNAGSSYSGSPLQDYFITRNRMIFGMKYAGLRAKLALFRESLRLLFVGRPWQRIGIRDFYLKKFARGSWRES